MTKYSECPNCKAPIMFFWKFCPVCAFSLTGRVPPPSAKHPYQCTACGFQFAAYEAIVCPDCGGNYPRPVPTSFTMSR